MENNINKIIPLLKEINTLRDEYSRDINDITKKNIEVKFNSLKEEIISLQTSINNELDNLTLPAGTTLMSYLSNKYHNYINTLKGLNIVPKGNNNVTVNNNPNNLPKGNNNVTVNNNPNNLPKGNNTNKNNKGNNNSTSNLK